MLTAGLSFFGSEWCLGSIMNTRMLYCCHACLAVIMALQSVGLLLVEETSPNPQRPFRVGQFGDTLREKKPASKGG
jgi:hypothetical protein